MGMSSLGGSRKHATSCTSRYDTLPVGRISKGLSSHGDRSPSPWLPLAADDDALIFVGSARGFDWRGRCKRREEGRDERNCLGVGRRDWSGFGWIWREREDAVGSIDRKIESTWTMWRTDLLTAMVHTSLISYATRWRWCADHLVCIFRVCWVHQSADNYSSHFWRSRQPDRDGALISSLLLFTYLVCGMLISLRL